MANKFLTVNVANSTLFMLIGDLQGHVAANNPAACQQLREWLEANNFEEVRDKKAARKTKGAGCKVDGTLTIVVDQKNCGKQKWK